LQTTQLFRSVVCACFLLASLGQRIAAQEAKEVTAVLEPFVKEHVLAGAVVLVADCDRVLCKEAVGFADVAGAIPMRADALFWIASQSKPITAVALMTLVDADKVRLDDPIEKYLPEFGGLWLAAERDKEHVLLKRPSRKVTVRDILSHTSGMPFRSPIEEPTLDGLRLRDAVGSYAMTPLDFEPGQRYQYSNAGINTAGRIIEVVTKMPYEAYLQKRLFDPLGMSDTTFWPSKGQLDRLAKSYKPGPDRKGLEETTIGQLSYPLDGRNRQPMPAGGLFSTADDIGKFCRMMLGGGVFEGRRILSEASVNEMTRKQTGLAIKDGYGLGWSVNGSTFGHGGAFSTNMSVDRERGLVLVFLVQHAGFPGDGAKSKDAFSRAALEQYGKTKRAN
jgi:CubicO group peptidase (beta-lactamase class C family)